MGQNSACHREGGADSRQEAQHEQRYGRGVYGKAKEDIISIFSVFMIVAMIAF